MKVKQKVDHHKAKRQGQARSVRLPLYVSPFMRLPMIQTLRPLPPTLVIPGHSSKIRSITTEGGIFERSVGRPIVIP